MADRHQKIFWSLLRNNPDELDEPQLELQQDVVSRFNVLFSSSCQHSLALKLLEVLLVIIVSSAFH